MWHFGVVDCLVHRRLLQLLIVQAGPPRSSPSILTHVVEDLATGGVKLEAVHLGQGDETDLLPGNGTG